MACGGHSRNGNYGPKVGSSVEEGRNASQACPPVFSERQNNNGLPETPALGVYFRLLTIHRVLLVIATFFEHLLYARYCSKHFTLRN